MSDTCPSCDHLKTDHTALAGCIAEDAEPCECERSFAEAKKTQATASAEKEEALERVERGTEPDWATAAASAVEHLAKRGGPFSSDDVWVLLEERGVGKPREPRALGTIMRELARGGTMKAHGYAPSARRHQTPVRTYVGAEA